MSIAEASRRFIARPHLHALVTVALAVLIVLWALRAVEPPNPVAVSAAAAEFSALRARAHLEVIAAAPRPTGSDEDRAVIKYLQEQLPTPWKVELQTATQSVAASRPGRPSSVARLTNVTATLEGTDSSRGAVMLVAHHDSVPTSPGGSDDGLGVATLLEVARAVRSGPRLGADIILLFTDAEELVSHGAEAFLEHDPRARHLEFVLNFDARGNAGPSMMFRSSGAAAPVGWLSELPHPVMANAFSEAVHRLLPNDTDFSTFAAAGISGLDFANIRGARHYHMPSDTAAAVDLRTLQHHGETALALTLKGAKAPVSFPVVRNYFNLGPWLITYPRSWTLPLAAALLAFAAIGFWKRSLKTGALAEMKTELRWIFPSLAAAGLPVLAEWALGRWAPELGTGGVGLWLWTMGLVGLSMTGALAVSRTPPDKATGASLCWAGAATACALIAPELAYLPLAGASVALVSPAIGGGGPRALAGLLAPIPLAAMVAVHACAVRDGFLATGPAVAFAGLVMGSAAGTLQRLASWAGSAGTLVLGVIALATSGASLAFSATGEAAHPVKPRLFAVQCSPSLPALGADLELAASRLSGSREAAALTCPTIPIVVAKHARGARLTIPETPQMVMLQLAFRTMPRAVTVDGAPVRFGPAPVFQLWGAPGAEIIIEGGGDEVGVVQAVRVGAFDLALFARGLSLIEERP